MCCASAPDAGAPANNMTISPPAGSTAPIATISATGEHAVVADCVGQPGGGGGDRHAATIARQPDHRLNSARRPLGYDRAIAHRHHVMGVPRVADPAAGSGAPP
jgi:hypothetical protein